MQRLHLLLVIDIAEHKKQKSEPLNIKKRTIIYSSDHHNWENWK